MECENCKRKNILICELASRVQMAKIDIDADLIERAYEESEKPPNVLLMNTKK